MDLETRPRRTETWPRSSACVTHAISTPLPVAHVAAHVHTATHSHRSPPITSHTTDRTSQRTSHRRARRRTRRSAPLSHTHAPRSRPTPTTDDHHTPPSPRTPAHAHAHTRMHAHARAYITRTHAHASYRAHITPSCCVGYVTRPVVWSGLTHTHTPANVVLVSTTGTHDERPAHGCKRGASHVTRDIPHSDSFSSHRLTQHTQRVYALNISTTARQHDPHDT